MVTLPKIKHHLADISPAVIRTYVDNQTCWICGRGGWVALIQHLNKKHGLLGSEVRDMALMFKHEPLISKELSDAFRNCRSAGLMEARLKVKRRAVSHKLSRAGEMAFQEAIKAIQILGSATQARGKRKPHPCPICGVLVPTSRPKCCSDECTRTSAKRSALTRIRAFPEAHAHFLAAERHGLDPERASAQSKKFWADMKAKPISEQKQIRAGWRHRRTSPVVVVPCVICNKPLPIPSYRINGKRRLTCSDKCSHTLRGSISARRIVSDITREKLRQIAIRRWACTRR